MVKNIIGQPPYMLWVEIGVSEGWFSVVGQGISLPYQNNGIK